MSYDAEVRTLERLLGAHATPIEVPTWQRNFSWRTSEAEVFWTDLLAFREELGTEYQPGGKQYFLGSIVLVGDETGQSLELLDGQQRLATTTILLATMRDFLAAHGSDLARTLSRDYIASEDAWSQSSTRFALTLNHWDRDFFRDFIQKPSSAKGTHPAARYASHRAIRSVYQLFRDNLDQATQKMTEDGAVEWVRDLVPVLMRGFSVVAVFSSDEDTAAEVFETLNDRGIGLSTPDLLRNLLLRRAPNSSARDEIVKDWDEILAIEEDARVDQFLRHYWISQKGDVKKHSLYREMKRELVERPKGQMAQFARQLRVAAEAYQDIAAARCPEDPEMARMLEGFSLLDGQAVMPALLSVWLTKAPWSARRKLVKSLISFFVRYRVVAGFENNQFENIVFELAKDISSGEDFASANARLAALPPTDDEFMERFRTLVVTRRRTARYLLIALENAAAPAGEKKVEAADRVHVEHIYPQRPRAGAEERDHGAIIDRLGNLTLLGRPLNLGIRNGTYDAKRTHAKGYAASEFLITKRLTEPPFHKVKRWTRKEIEARQTELALAARAIWTLDV